MVNPGVPDNSTDFAMPSSDPSPDSTRATRSPRRARVLFLTFAAVVGIGTAATMHGCSWLDVKQRELIFRPMTEDWRGFRPDILAYEDVWIPVGTNGDRLHGWWVPAQGASDPDRSPTILYLHGARWNLTGSAYRIAGLQQMGFNILAIDYRGFGRSSALLPSEASAYEDADAAWRWLDSRAPDPSRRVLYGHSLGGAVAAHLASSVERAGGLVLESTFTSIKDLAERTAARFLPLDALLTQRFDVAEKIARARMPVIIVHGKDDPVVPVEMAEQLYAVAAEPKRLFVVEGAGHRLVARRIAGELREALVAALCGPLSAGTQFC